MESTPQWSDVHHTVQSVPDLHVNFAPPVTLAEVDRWSPPRAPLRLLSIDEASDCTSFTGSSEPPSPTKNSHSSTSSNRKRRRKAGLRALRFLKYNSFSQHAVFCLLSGRPLVVIGGDESLVRKLVDALSLFLPAPGPDGNAVMPCLTMPLQLTDLLTWRLIGIHRYSIRHRLLITCLLSSYFYLFYILFYVVSLQKDYFYVEMPCHLFLVASFHLTGSFVNCPYRGVHTEGGERNRNTLYCKSHAVNTSLLKLVIFVVLFETFLTG